MSSEISAISSLYQKNAPEIVTKVVFPEEKNEKRSFQLKQYLQTEKCWILLVFQPWHDSTESLKDEWSVLTSNLKSFHDNNCQIFAVVSENNKKASLSPSTSHIPATSFPVLFDSDSKDIGKTYEVLLSNDDYAHAVFVISPEGIIRHISLYDSLLNLHNIEELLYLLSGFQSRDKNKSITPASHNNAETTSTSFCGFPRPSLSVTSLSCISSPSNVFSCFADKLRSFHAFYSHSLQERPILTKSITSCIIAMIGELIGSGIHNSKAKMSDSQQRYSPLPLGRNIWEISRRLIVFGLYGISFTGKCFHFFSNLFSLSVISIACSFLSSFVGPFFHWWYRYLHQTVSSWHLSPSLTIIVKVLLNQLIMTPPFLVFTISFLQFFFTFSKEKTIKVLKNTFASALFMNWKV
jgi:alkyl hydroperoxide reductase subunit AhpC